MLKAVSAQCRTCTHHQRRGGIVLPAQMQCVRLEDSETAQVVVRMLQLFAAEGRYPEHTPYAFHRDTYLSDDLTPIDLEPPVPVEN